MPQNGVRFKPLTFYVDYDDFVGMWLFVCKLPIGTCSSNFELGRRTYDWMRFWLVKNAEVNCFYLLKTNAKCKILPLPIQGAGQLNLSGYYQ